MIEWAYLLQKEPEYYAMTITKIKETERMVAEKGRKYLFKGMTGDEFDNLIRNKWLRILENKQNYRQMTLFD